MLVLSCSICSVTAWPAAYFRVHNFFHFLIFECKVQIFHLQCTWNHFKSSQLLLLSYSWCSTLKSIGLCVFLKAPKIGSALPPACLQSASSLSLHPLELPGVCAVKIERVSLLRKIFLVLVFWKTSHCNKGKYQWLFLPWRVLGKYQQFREQPQIWAVWGLLSKETWKLGNICASGQGGWNQGTSLATWLIWMDSSPNCCNTGTDFLM